MVAAMVTPGLLIGPQEMLFVALLLLLVFGSSQLPKIAGTIGESLGQLRDIASGINPEEDEDLEEALEEAELEDLPGDDPPEDDPADR